MHQVKVVWLELSIRYIAAIHLYENEKQSTSICRGGQSATSAIAEVAMRINFLFWNIAELRCASIARKSSLRKLRCASEVKKIKLRNFVLRFYWLKRSLRFVALRFWHNVICARDVEAVKFLMLPLPAPLEVLCFRVRFRFLTFGIFCFRFRLRVELVASEFASASSLFYQSASASTKM